MLIVDLLSVNLYKAKIENIWRAFLVVLYYNNSRNRCISKTSVIWQKRRMKTNVIFWRRHLNLHQYSWRSPRKVFTGVNNWVHFVAEILHSMKNLCLLSHLIVFQAGGDDRWTQPRFNDWSPSDAALQMAQRCLSWSIPNNISASKRQLAGIKINTW